MPDPDPDALAVLAWTADALDGRAVPDFAASFPVVRAALDVRGRAVAAEEAVADLLIYAAGRCPPEVWVRLRAVAGRAD